MTFIEMSFTEHGHVSVVVNNVSGQLCQCVLFSQRVSVQDVQCRRQTRFKSTYITTLLSYGPRLVFHQQNMSDWPSFRCVIKVHQYVCARKITSLCVQPRLWFVSAWLTDRHCDTDTRHFAQFIWIAQPAELSHDIDNRYD